MPKIRYVGPIVGVDIVIVGLSGVEPGDEFDADHDAARALLGDDSMYVPADKAAQAVVDELEAEAQAKAEAEAAAQAQADVDAEVAAAAAEAAAVLAQADADEAARQDAEISSQEA